MDHGTMEGLAVDVDIIILVSAIMLCIFTQNQDPALHTPTIAGHSQSTRDADIVLAPSSHDPVQKCHYGVRLGEESVATHLLGAVIEPPAHNSQAGRASCSSSLPGNHSERLQPPCKVEIKMISSFSCRT